MPYKDPAKGKASRAAYYRAHRDEYLRRSKLQKRAMTPEQRRVAWRKYQAKRREQINAKARERRGRRDGDARKREHVKMRAYFLKTKFGLSLQDYESMLVAQGGLCAICRQPETYVKNGKDVALLGVDHDHTTGAVRGLLCNNCNRGIGLLKDDPLVLRAATVYLERGR